MRVRVLDEEYDVSVRAFAWEKPDALDAVDGTIEVVAKSIAAPEDDALGFIHGRFARIRPGGPFGIPLAEGDLVSIVESFFDYECDGPLRIGKSEDGGRLRNHHARWGGSHECPVEHTSAPWYSILAAPWEALEGTPFEGRKEPVSLDELCAFYDESSDPFVRFEIMQYALFDYERAERAPWANWFETTLRRNFALHGHTIAYWAALDHEPEARFFDDGQFIWKMLRGIWDQSLVPVDAALVAPSSDLASAPRG